MKRRDFEREQSSTPIFNINTHFTFCSTQPKVFVPIQAGFALKSGGQQLRSSQKLIHKEYTREPKSLNKTTYQKDIIACLCQGSVHVTKISPCLMKQRS